MSFTNSALNLLAVYNSSSESEEEIPGPRVSVKRTHSNDEGSENRSKRQATCDQKKRLPLPSALMQLFQAEKEIDSPVDDHNGRIRSFPHERGNWASLVYVNVEPTASLQSYIDVVCSTCDPFVDLQRSADLHISLSKTVVLKHHWIESISSSVQKLAQSMTRFPVCFGEVKVYTNEEQTRTFIGIVVTAGRETLTAIALKLDEILADFKLPSFYEEASFHISIASCVGNHTNTLNSVLPKLQTTLDMFLHSQPLHWSLNVDKINFRTGNKFFAFHLLS